MCPNMRPRSQSISVRFVSHSLSFTVAHATRIRMHWQIAYTDTHPSHLICINWYNPYRSIAFGLLFARLCLRCIGMLACDSRWHDTHVRVPSMEQYYYYHSMSIDSPIYYDYATDCHNVNPFRNGHTKRCDAIRRNIELWPAQQCSYFHFCCDKNWNSFVVQLIDWIWILFFHFIISSVAFARCSWMPNELIDV